MSTNINITVGDSGLLDRAKQQQAASRQTQLNREASVQLEAEATAAFLTNANAIASGAAFNAARTAAFAAQGRDAQGNLITAPSRIQPYIAPRPAANRSGGGTKWIFDYSDLRRCVWLDTIYYRGTFLDISRRLGYVAYGGYQYGGNISTNLRTSSDVRGAFISEAIPKNIPRLINLVYGTPTNGDLFDLTLEAPSRPFNKISVETWCYTPRPNIPDQLPLGQSPSPNYGVRIEVFRLSLSAEEIDIFAPIDIFASFTLFISRLSDNFPPSASYPTQDSASLSTEGSINGQFFQNYTVVDLPMLGALETYTVKIVYDGTTGILQVSINGINAINQFTGFTLSRQKYTPSLITETVVQTAPGGEDYMRSEPPIKMYKKVYTFS